MAVTDDFNRADSGSLGANWTDLETGLQIISNRVYGESAGIYQWGVYSGSAWSSDHTSQCVIYGIGGIWDDGPIVRAANSGGVDGYMSMSHSSNLRRIYRRDNGSFTEILNNDGTTAAGDTVKLTATGTTLEHFRNGASLGSTTDATYSTGTPGIYCRGDTTGGGVDNWEGTGESGGGAFDPATGFAYIDQTHQIRQRHVVVAY